jgi:hypothetical protein
LFEPSFHEHHKSYLRQIFSPENQSPLSLKSLTFYGIQGLNVSEEDIAVVNQKQDQIDKINFVFMSEDIQPLESYFNDEDLGKIEGNKSAIAIDLSSI